MSMPGQGGLWLIGILEADVNIGRIGIWTFQFDQQPWGAVAEAAAELDDLGFGAL